MMLLGFPTPLPQTQLNGSFSEISSFGMKTLAALRVVAPTQQCISGAPIYIYIYSLKDKAHSSPPERLPEIGTKTMKNEV